MFTIDSQADYGMIIIEQALQAGGQTSLAKLAENTGLPPRFTAKIATMLAKNKLLASREGRGGGYSLTAKVRKISLYNYLKIFDRELSVCRCDKDGFNCDYKGVCSHGSKLRSKVNRIFTVQLKKVKLLELVK